MVVYPHREPDEGSPQHIWSNLDLEDAFPKSLAPYLEVFEGWGVALPPQLVRALYREKEFNR